MASPTLSGLDAPTFDENTVNATPQVIDDDVTFADADEDFNGGVLTVSGLLAQDRVSVKTEGLISFNSGTGAVSYNGVVIGTAAGGSGATFTVTFNANATAAGIEALIEHLTYANTSNTPTASRDLVINVTDAGGHGMLGALAFTEQTGGDNPFNGVDVGIVSMPTFADLDGDGDLDAVIGAYDGVLTYLENTGTALNPVFTQRTGAANPFDGVDIGYYSRAAFGDLDGDGDLDAVLGDEAGRLRYFENTGTALAPVFTQRTGPANPFEGVDVGLVSAPVFADLDNDGDLDAVVGETDTFLNYFENTGTASAPVFTARTGGSNPFNGLSLGYQTTPALADLDGDGDLDVVVGENHGTLYYFENTGTALAPVFTARTDGNNPFDGVDTVFRSAPVLADLDGDGDLDTLLGRHDGSLTYLQNTTIHGQALTVRVIAQNDAPTLTGLSSSVTFAENTVNAAARLIDSDVVFDDPEANFAGGSLTISGLLAEDTIAFQEQGTGAGQIHVDAQGRIYYGGVMFAQADHAGATTTGQQMYIVFQAAATSAAIDALIQAMTYANSSNTPTASRNINLMIADNSFAIRNFGVTINVTAENDAQTLTGLTSPATFAENTVNAAAQLLDSDVTFTDPDNGFNGGHLTVTGALAEDTVGIRNQGTGAGQIGVSGNAITYAGVQIGTFTGGAGATLNVTFNASATAASIDALIQNLTYANSSDTPTASRSLYLQVTDVDGHELTGNAAPAYTQLPDSQSPFAAMQFDLYGAGAGDFADLDNDGDQDFILAPWSGSLRYFQNTGSTTSPVFTERTGGANPFNGLGTGERAVRLVDLDGDGDLDAVTGQYDSGNFNLFYYRNDGTAASPSFAQTSGAANPFDGFSLYNSASPSFADLDNDGDLDALLGYQYFRNVGSATAPSFQEVIGAGNPFQMLSLGFDMTSLFRDFDRDGDLDLLTGDGNGLLRYFRNDGTASAPVFVRITGAANPFNGMLSNTGVHAAPTDVDIDGDGDVDIINIRYFGNFTYVRNDTPSGVQITVNVTAEADGINGDSGNNTLAGTGAADNMDGGDGDDTLDGGAGDDVLVGGAGADYLKGGAGGDEMRGGAGNDTYIVDSFLDLVDETGGDGVDLVRASVSWAITTGIENLDLLSGGGAINGVGNSLDNVINGNSYENTLYGLDGADTLNGGGGNDNLYGGTGGDYLYGGNGDDQLFGDDANDLVDGGAGNDLIDGGEGADNMVGGAGNDVFILDNAADGILEFAGAGTDEVRAWVGYVLGANLENLTLMGSSDINGWGNTARNTITGNSGANGLHGGDEVDTISGGDGDDSLWGDAGNDVLGGGNGADVLYGGAGSDKLTGGAGADGFVFTSLDVRLSGGGQTPEKDQILDLSFAAGDRIDLSDVYAGTLAFTAANKFTGHAGELVLKYAAGTGLSTLEIDVDGDGKADLRVEINGDLTGTRANLYTGGGDTDGGWVL